MRKALILCGSARMNGVTDSMCKAAAKELEALGYDPLVITVTDDVSHCRNCGLCKDGQCAIDDAMTPIYTAFSEADLLVLATPIHFSGPSSLIKAAIDRFQPYWFDRGSPHPSMVMGLMCGGSEKPEFRPTVSVFRAFSAMLGMRWLGHLEISGTDEMFDGDIGGKVASFIAETMGAAER